FPPPIITSFSPTVAAPGASVTITGSNFASTGTNTVFFGATQGTVTSATQTSLTVTVPSEATYAPISVTTNGVTGLSRARFFPDFSTSGVLDVNSFAAKVDKATDPGPQILALGDLNADGLTDVLVP